MTAFAIAGGARADNLAGCVFVHPLDGDNFEMRLSYRVVL
jgi:hypothetical protein